MDNDTDNVEFCGECVDALGVYDCFYLSFMALLPLLAETFIIQVYIYNHKLNLREQAKLTVTAVGCQLVCALLSLLLIPPVGSLRLLTCPQRNLTNWFTMRMGGPTPCTSEAVFPLYSLPLIYYGLCLLSVSLIRGVLHSPLYMSLYLYPSLALLSAVAGGLLYHCWPYLLLLALLSSQSLLLATQPTLAWRHLVSIPLAPLLLAHCALFAFASLALAFSSADAPPALSVLPAVFCPAPLVFYIVTSPLTDPTAVAK